MFDPYLEWLQIPVERRPPTHYDLLGLPPCESDAARIHKAAMERMALVRRYQLGAHADTVTRLLAELSAAFNCLSDPQCRSAYDEQLRSASTALPHEAATTRTPADAGTAGVASGFRGKRRRPSPLSICLVGAGLLAAVVAALIWLPPPAANLAGHQTTAIVAGRPNVAEEAPPIAEEKVAPVVSPGEAEPTSSPRPRGRDPQIRFFGYGTAGPPGVIEEIAPYTNVVFIRDWVDRSNELIVAAEEAGLPIVLCVQGKEMTEKGGQLRRVLTRRTGGILAVCWVFPYHAGFKSGDVVNLGRRIKQEHPGVQYWLASMDRAIDQPEPNHVPSIVDAVVVVEPLDYTPQAVTAKADEYLPAWHKLAAGRPIIWYWLSGVPGSKGGIVPTTVPGTFRACLDAARRYKLAGLAFDRYGDPKGQERVPIDSRPELVEEIRSIAGELGFDLPTPPRPDAR